MKNWDVAVIGAGVIGLSLAVELRRGGMSVLVLERGQPGREASWAAGGMIVECDPHNRPELQTLASASAHMYPQFAHGLEDESGVNVDLRSKGTIRFVSEEELPDCVSPHITPEELANLEPELVYQGAAVKLDERCVDPRLLMEALIKAAKHLAVDISSGSEVIGIEVIEGRASSVTTTKSRYPAAAIVNCAGAWASQIGPVTIPTRPIKGQMLCVASRLVQHVVRSEDVYLIPRSDGRLVIGATVEDAGFDKRVDAATIQRLHQSAANLVPNLGEARILEDWAGLRPGTPDKLPIMGATSVPGYYAATGHYRDGILLAPITAKLMGQVIRGQEPEIPLQRFSPARFC